MVCAYTTTNSITIFKFKRFLIINIQIYLCKFYILFATGFGGKRLRPFQAKIKYETAYNNVS